MSLPNRIVCLMAIFIIFSPPLFSAYNDTGMGARPVAMGNVFTGTADDSSAMYYNPAGLAIVDRVQLGSTYCSFLSGLTDGTVLYESDFSFALPLGEAGIGFSWQELALSSLYSEDTVSAGFGFKVGKEIALGTDIFLGASAKLRSLGFGRSDWTDYNSAFTALGASAFSFDAGILILLSPALTAGFAVIDLNEPNIGIFESSVLPMTIRGSISIFPLAGGSSRNLILGAEGVKRGNVYKVSAGTEYWLLDKTACLRAGYSRGNGGLSTASFGAGLLVTAIFPLRLDYAFLMPLSGQELGGNHRLSLNMLFDSAPKKKAALTYVTIKKFTLEPSPGKKEAVQTVTGKPEIVNAEKKKTVSDIFITGRIMDTDGNPLGLSMIKVLNTAQEMNPALSLDDGTYKTREIPAGKYRVRVSRMSFETVEQEVDVSDGNPVIMDFIMKKKR